jgi:hypothetical protein
MSRVSCPIQISSSDKDAGPGDGAVLVELFSLGRFQADCATRSGRNRTPRLTNADVRRLLSQAEKLQHTSDDAWLAVRFHAAAVEEDDLYYRSFFLVPV